MTGLETIPKRRDFVLVSTHGRRYAMPGLVLQMRDRGDDAGARLGITASKKSEMPLHETVPKDACARWQANIWPATVSRGMIMC